MTASMPELTLDSDGTYYNFGSFCLYPDGTLLRDAREVRLAPKELALLRVLIVRAGQVVPLEQLRSSAWGDVHVSADSLPRCVSSLRARLESQSCIQTIYKRGYRFVLPVKLISLSSQADRSSAQPDTDRRTTRATGLPRLAIMPFSTADDVPSFFGTAITDETMIRLARSRNPVAELMARDSVLRLVARGAGAQEAGTALGADLALAGSITALPLHYRLRIEMIRVADAVQLWVEDFLLPRIDPANVDALAGKRIAARIRNTVGLVVASTNTPAAASIGVNAAHEARRSDGYMVTFKACEQPPEIL
jgi:DNA-binding winged helix-turn-helix (wHTH) protein